ncbi:DnaB-like helicase N-terminal domain-containing protein [Sulfurimonas sp.]|uniref:DnaB-like helicase N-terminal domain-containing protein n=1 Tax=Sulfurimonas sp. TaxID=2022749 RepID=UPI003D0FD59D
MNEQNYNTNIEKSILSSIIFEPSLFDELGLLLKKDDFYLPAHQDIYSAIVLLVSKEKPIDEEFIANELKRAKRFNEAAMLEVLSANPLTSLHLFEYIKELRTDAINREMSILGYKIAQGDIEAITKLQELKETLLEIGGERRLKKPSDSKTFWDKIDMDTNEIENLKFVYLYDHFIVKNEITMIAARPGSGKSLTAMALANILLTNRTIEYVFYLDGDNGKSTLKERKIHDLKQKWGERLRMIEGKSKKTYDKAIRELKNMDLTNCVVFFDSIKNFMDGGDRDKNKDVSKVMEVLKALRNNGATVIFLHHSNKPQKDISELMYAGSSAWEEDTGNAYILKKNEYKGTFIFYNIKKRTGDLQDMAFIYNADKHWLHKVLIEEAKQTKEDEEMIKETLGYLESSRQKPMWSELHKNLTDLGYDKEKASKVIKNNEGKLWNFQKGERNNQKLYSLIEPTAATTKSKTVEVIYEKQKSTPRSQTTPRSPLLDTFTNPTMDKNSSDNSQRFQERASNVDIVPITPRSSKIDTSQDMRVYSDKSHKSVLDVHEAFGMIEMPIL